MLAPIEPLQPVAAVFPALSKRAVNEACRAGKIPGAVKVARTWMIRARDVEALVNREPACMPTVADAIADLRKRGLR